MPKPAGLGVLQGVEKSIANALRSDRREPLVALGQYLTAARDWRRGNSGAIPATPRRADDYNFAVARVFGTIPRPSSIRGRSRCECRRRRRIRAHAQARPAPAVEPRALRVHAGGSVRHPRHLRHASARARMASARRSSRSDARRTGTAARRFRCRAFTTASPRSCTFRGRRCVLSFEDPLATETVRFGGASFPLAADFTVPLAVMLASRTRKSSNSRGCCDRRNTPRLRTSHGSSPTIQTRLSCSSSMD